MKIEILSAYDMQEEIVSLFSEYTDYLIKGDAVFAEYLKQQKFDKELEDLSEKYGMPWGRLYLLRCDDKTAGCIALRKIDDNSCELKRLYIKPEFRGNGISKTLVARIISDAKEIGYQYILLDTLPFLKSAIQLYRSAGFYEIEKFNDSPMQGSLYMRYDL